MTTGRDGASLATSGASMAEGIEAQANRIAVLATTRQFAADPTLEERFGERGRRKCTEDALRHLSYLSSAVRTDSEALFTDYVGWAKIVLARLGLSDRDLAHHLGFIREALGEALDGAPANAAVRIVDAALRDLPAMPTVGPSLLPETEPHAALARQYLELLLAGDRASATALILDAVRNDGVDIRDIYLHVFQRTQHEIGRRWQMNEMSVAEEHFCTAATQLIMSQLYPYIFAAPRVGRRLVAACVGGDLHEIGLRMVADFFEMDGWDTHYLGANTPIAGIVEATTEQNADVLAISATMTFHVAEVTEAIRAVRQRGNGRSPRILVGGYPFRVDPELWRAVGADGFATDAMQAVAVANRLVETPKNA